MMMMMTMVMTMIMMMINDFQAAAPFSRPGPRFEPGSFQQAGNLVDYWRGNDDVMIYQIYDGGWSINHSINQSIIVLNRWWTEEICGWARMIVTWF